MSPSPFTAAQAAAAVEALAPHLGVVGCTCRWDEDGNPPSDCRCGERADASRVAVAREVLAAAHAAEPLVRVAVVADWVRTVDILGMASAANHASYQEATA